MIWSEDDIKEMQEKLNLLSYNSSITDYFDDVPEYIFGRNWTDEMRIKNGFEQVNGAWFRKSSVEDYWKTRMNDVNSLLKEKNRLSDELALAKGKLREMEYGLRAAQKSLIASMNLKLGE